VSRPETKLWFYFLAASFIDAGFEAIHFGQTELMNGNDRSLEHYSQLLALIRSYAAKHARRHMVLCDSHVPSGGLLRQGRLLMDFHSFPLRIMEVPDKPQEAILKVGFSDSIYGRSKGGLTPSGWKCEHLPYLVEIDNWGVSKQPGKAKAGGIWVWGYDEITWFAHQSRQYRGEWLRYAWDWVRRTDPNGYLQMPGSRTLASPLDRKRWYYANTPSPVVPDGLGDEEAIRAIWAADSHAHAAGPPSPKLSRFPRVRSQTVILKGGRGQHRKYLPYAFTEQGVAMLSGVLRSPRAVEINIQIMRAFVRLRQLLSVHKELAERLTKLEAQMRQRDHAVARQFQQVFALLDQLFKPPSPPRTRIGFHAGDETS
jgi:hypothetical protein